MSPRRYCVGPATLLILSLIAPARAGEREDRAEFYARKVRPILAQNCFKCHGPDDKARKARLRLDLRDEAIRPARSGLTPIVPGKPEKSELITRIFSREETEVMPPPATKLSLTEAEKKILREWIASGAEYSAHWAFVTPRRPELPAVKDTSWPKNAIDRFVLARLEREGLQPSPRADRYTLIRRVYLDLIGLPPTPEEADAFVRDSRPDAYERLVDRLLASPHYGELWARRWLDLARYADTNGYEKDRPRSIWPYRDWVIRAINAGMPFDRFSIEQLAGDLLPNATLEQRIATGFHRNTMLNEEGGIDPLEFRFHAMTDRVATTATIWLGLTMGCVQCHSHKYDPISQREYYQFLAFLNNADEPELEVPEPSIKARRSVAEKMLADRLAGLEKAFPREKLPSRFAEWRKAEAEKSLRWSILRPAKAEANLPFLTVLPDDSVLASGDQSKRDWYDLTFTGSFEGVTALRLEALTHDSLPRRGPGRVYYEGVAGDFFLSEISVWADGQPIKLADASHGKANGKFVAKNAIDGDPQSGWSIAGRQGHNHVAVFNLAAPLGKVKELKVRLLFERYYAAGLGRFRLSATRETRKAVARGDIPSEVEDLLAIPDEKLTPRQRQRLLQEFLLIAPETARERAEIDLLRSLLDEYPRTLVLVERPANNPRPTHVHNRGEFTQPGERVEPAVPAFLHAFPRNQPRNRLGFAHWLMSPENPLVGRVTMNRHWAAFFGQGIVKTVEDFGFQGDWPTHPELLDWLAVEFTQSQGWSLKAMHRLIVTSATYQQSARVSPQLKTRDPENRLLARGPRLRLEAEQLRDSALAVSGLLARKIGGPSVFPPQPPGVTTEWTFGRLEWKVSAGLDRYRRGLYTFTKRTAPFAMSATFDGPSGEVCVPRRERTNTPLQALTLLNDPAFVEAAQALGRQMATLGGKDATRVRQMFRRCLIRPPDDDEVKLMVQFLQAQRQRLQRGELDAQELAGAGEGDSQERAAWTALARVLLNLDEAIVRN